MTKRIFIIIFLCSALLNVYLLLGPDLPSSKPFDSMSSLNIDKISVTQAGLTKPNLEKKRTKKSALIPKNTNMNISQPALYTGLPNEEEIIESEEKWRSSIGEFFVQDLELDESDVDRYFDIKDSRDKELADFLNEKIKNQGSHIFTLEDMVEESKINKKYLDELLSLMGEDGYSAYKKMRNEYNKKIMESQEMYFLIEL